MKLDRLGVRLSGRGGQGVITAGVVLSEAAMLDGLNAVQTQSYGPEARLGASRAEVILSAQPIAYPQVDAPDVLLCLSEDAFLKFYPQIGPDTVVVVDTSNVAGADGADDPRVVRLPLTETAVAATARKVTANVVALGATNALLGIVAPESLREAVLRRVPPQHRALNARALAAGVALAARSSQRA